MQKNLAMLSNVAPEDLKLFKTKLASYKKLIDADIDAYSRQLESTTAEQFGELSTDAIKAYTSILNRGGKRIRGSLTMFAYEMFGGTDQAMVIKAARVMEMIQAYVLILDDIADRSPSRRGGPTAHMQVKYWYDSQHLGKDSLHFGEAIATNAATLGCHVAFEIIAELAVSDTIKIQAMQNLNQNLIVTAHGQCNDLYNEALQINDETAIENVLVWKTAYYTFVNPLQFGAILAGTTNGDLETLAKYGLHAGRTFQITDDILGTFSDEQNSGKSPLDDTKEGKRTILVAKALQNASKPDAYFLETCLGNQHLTAHDFERAKKILRESGALDYANEQAATSAQSAVQVINDQSKKWDKSSCEFLIELVHYLLMRKA